MTQPIATGGANQLASYVNRRISRILSMSAPGPQKALLANLRRGAGKELGELPALWSVLLEDFPEAWMNSRGVPSRAEWAAYISLTLFAVHQQGKDPAVSPMHCPECTLGRAVRLLVPAGDEDAEKRILRRFQQMATAAQIQGVAQHLRGIVQLLRAAGIPLDYAALAHDLYQYQFPEAVAGVRLCWARDFYRQSLTKQESTNTSEGKED
ncbi:MAG: type I-E CRISPR-associated protein Cse2/CasB [Butyricicoccus sp.]|nr:type I-E CRISPR-associated protein Cse2/CasB [Butyricicoccus sp.]